MLDDMSIEDYVKNWTDEIVSLAITELEWGNFQERNDTLEFLPISIAFSELEDVVGMHVLSEAKEEKKYAIKVMFVKLLVITFTCFGILYFKFRG